MSTNKKNDAHATAIGKFFRISENYIAKYKIGGCQKLQKIVGEDLFFKKRNGWWWSSRKVISMSVSQLEILIKKIENA